MHTDVTMIKSITVTSDIEDQYKSTDMNTDILSTMVTSSTDEQKKSIKKSLTVSKRYRKCKHHCHHRRTKPKKPVTIIREYLNTDDQEKLSPTTLNQKSETKTVTITKGNIRLNSIENKLTSQRKTSKNETKVEHCSSFACNQCAPAVTNNTCNVQEIVCEDNCYAPSTTVSCTCTSCCTPQSNQVVCVAQQPQPQPQIILCNDACSSQNFICSPSTMPVNQNSMICVSKPAIQQPANIIIQQQPAQIQAQPIQFIQIPQVQASPSIQLVQNQPAQYLQISSATPQVIQTVQVPSMQSIQPQIIQASPQVLYQRPYDPVVIPIQNQQLAIRQRPVVAMSQPSYAPLRQTQGPHMFEHALVRTIANRVGVPVPLAASGGPSIAQPLTSTASPLLLDGAQPSTSLPIIPLTPGGLLIPFQSSDSPRNMAGGNLMQTGGFPTKLNNMEQMRQRLLQRAQLLASLKQPVSNVNQVSPQLPLYLADPPPVRSVSRPSGVSPPSFSTLPPPPSRTPFPTYQTTARTPFSSLSTNLPPASNAYPSSNLNSSFASNPIVPPTLFGSQTPYTSGKIANVSDTSSSSTKSSESSTAPSKGVPIAPSGLVYSQPSFAGSPGGSIISGPAPTYQSVRP